MKSGLVVNKCYNLEIIFRKNSLHTFGDAMLSSLTLAFVALPSFSCSLNRILGVHCIMAAIFYNGK